MTDKKKGEGSRAPVDEAPAAPAPAYVENLLAPELYVDNVPLMVRKYRNLSMTLTSWRFDNSTTPAVGKHVIIGRLVMPIDAAKLLADNIYEHLQKNGLLPDKTKAN